MTINGKEIAKKIIDRLKELPKPKKFLAAVLIGENATSLSFLEQKEKTAKELGLDFRLYKLDEEKYTNDSLREEIGKISKQKPVGGLIIQLPLPKKFNSQYILNAISREKDIDLLSERSLGSFYTNRSKILPPSVETLKEIIKEINLDLSNKKIGIVGLGGLVGKPISTWLIGKAKEVLLLDSGSDLNNLKQMDLVISGVGIAHLIKYEMIKTGAIIVDFGYDFLNGKICGDIDPKIENIASFMTPTPHGTGPILVAKLLENFYKLNQPNNHKRI